MLERNAPLSRDLADCWVLSSFIFKRDASGEITELMERDNSVAIGKECAKERLARTPRRSADSKVKLSELFQRATVPSLLTEALNPRENTAANGSTTVKERSALQLRNVVSGEEQFTRTPSNFHARLSRESVENKRNAADPS